METPAQICRTSAGKRKLSLRLDRMRYAEIWRNAYGRTCVDGCSAPCRWIIRGIPHNAEVLEERHKLIQDVWEGMGDIRVSKDRTLIWNTDLIESLGFEKLISQAAVTVYSGALYRVRKAAAPMRVRISKSATIEFNEAYAVICRLRQAHVSSSTSARCTISRSRTRWLTSSRKSGCIERLSAFLLVRDAARSLSSTVLHPLEIERLGEKDRIGKT